MITQCQCQFCGGNIEFEAEAAGTFIACPVCSKQTRLLISKSARRPPVVKETFIQRESGLLASSRAAQPEPVETKLDILGGCFFWGGILIAFVMGVFLMVAIAEDQPGKLQLVLIMVGAVGQGIIARVLFQAGAEVVRLLRKTSQKP